MNWNALLYNPGGAVVKAHEPGDGPSLCSELL